MLYNYMYQKAFINKVPLSLMMELLTKCNLKCKHCYLPEHIDEGLDFNIIKNIIKQFRDMGGLNVSLTGGEILLRKDIFDIITYIRSLHMRVILLSNATLLDLEMSKKLSRLHIAEFSTTIFSLNANVHDEITGVHGSLKKVLENLEMLKNVGIRVQVKTPLMETNMYDYKDIRSYCRENGFKYHVSPLIFEKIDGDISPLKLSIPMDKLKPIIPELDEETRNDHIYINDVPCAALHFSFAINCKGKVYPCNTCCCEVGDVFHKSLKEIWFDSEILNQIRNIKKRDLIKCLHCNLRTQCNRCPALAYNKCGDFLNCDEYAKAFAEVRIRN